MLLSLYSINLFGQTKTQTDSLVVVDIATIRKANEKLIEANYLKNVVANQNDIIFNYKIMSEKQDSLIYKYAIKNITLEEELSTTKTINENLNKSIQARNIAIGTLSGVSAAAIATIVIFLTKR